MKLLIEYPTDEILEKLRGKRAILESDLEGIVLKEVINIYQGSLGLVVKFRTHINTVEEIELINSDCRNIDLYTD